MTKKILIVDDDENNLLILDKLLKKEGYDPVHAENGNIALSVVQKEKIDLVLLDWMMPDISGLEVCKKIKGNPETLLIPIIILSARGDTEDIQEGLDVGADDYVTKPIVKKVLFARIRASLRKSELTRGKGKELDIINEITKLMGSEDDIEDKLFQVVDLMKIRMNADSCSLFLLDNLSNSLILEASSGVDLPKDKKIEMSVNDGITGWVVRNKKLVSLENVETDPRVKFISEIHENRFKSLLSVPLMAGDEILGTINFQTTDPRKYSKKETRAMNIACSQVALVLQSALLKLRMEADQETLLVEKGVVPGEFVGKSPGIKKINKFISQTVNSNKPILLVGEEGTGKELMARLIHSRSPRKDGPFLEVDCSHFAEKKWGDELFGTEEGANDQSKTVKRGYIEKADKGILFLKNVEKLKSISQLKLSDFIQSGLFIRVGGKTRQRANTRIISTTGTDIKELASSGSFNKDTYEYLKAFEFTTEPLRKMKRDIPELCHYLLKRICRQIHKEELTLSETAEKRVQSYDWPGNVSELENVLKGAAIVAPRKVIEDKLLFFPSRSPTDKPVLNLLGDPRVAKWASINTFPDLISKAGLAAFAISIILLLVFPQNNLLNSAFWSLGWFSIFLVTFFIGRIFCAVCPFMKAGELIQKWKNFKMSRPEIILHSGESIALTFIFVIFWIEGSYGLSQNPIYTAILLLIITSGAMVCAAIFERRLWCRYLCPMGSLLGTFSLTSFFSVGANKHVCMYRCATHDCYIGKEDVPGCQLYLHPYGIESPQHCVFCMQCHKNCPNESVKLNLQFPGTGILSVSEPSLAVAIASTALLGILPVEHGGLFAPGTKFFDSFIETFGLDRIPVYAFAFLCAGLLPFAALLIMERFLGGHNFTKSVFRLKNFGYAMLPLALLGHIAFYGKKTVLWIEDIITKTWMEPIDFFSANLVFFVMFVVVVFLGVGGTVHTYIRIYRNDPQTFKTRKRLICGYAGFTVFYVIIYLVSVSTIFQ